MMNVKSRYLAISGSTREVGGRIFDTSKRNTTSERRMLIPSVTYEMKKIVVNYYILSFNQITF